MKHTIQLYPLKGAVNAEPNGVHFTVFPYIGVGDGTGGFKNTGDERPFENLIMFYLMEGLAKAAPKGST